jgi:coenzyme F420 hydrogenase subunit beta
MADETPVNFVERPDSADPYWKITGGPPGDGLGAVLESYAARTGSRPEFAQDGGVVSGLLLAALASGEIDGALVTKPSSDPDEPWKGVSHLATTAKEIIDAAGSYYNQTMALAELDLTNYDLPPNPRIAVVGTPCEIQGIRAMQSRRWPTGVHRVDAVVLTIALLCTKSFDYQGLMLRLLRDVEYRDGEVAVDEPIKNFHGAALKGCDECADFLGRGADLSVGSVGSIDGWSSVLVRTERGRLAVDNARGRLDLRELDNPEALVKLDAFDKRIAFKSLQRKFDPDAPLFIDYEEHLSNYSGTDRAPVVIDR